MEKRDLAMSASLTTRFLTDAEFPKWNALVSQSPTGSIFSTPEYLEVLCASAGGDFRVIVAERGGCMVGGIALYERSSSAGRYCTGRLLLYYNGIVEKTHESTYPSERTSKHNELTSSLEEAIASAGYGRVEIRNMPAFNDARVFQSRGWNVSPSYSYVVPLSDLQGQWQRVEKNLRRLIQRCEREGAQITDDEDFASFYRMHEMTNARKRAPLYLPRVQFENYFSRLHAQGLCRLYHARLPDGRAVSSQIVLLGTNPVTHTVAAGQDPEFSRMGATPFLRWKVFERLAQMGHTGNDLTDAALNPVTHFKSELGGDLLLSLVLSRPDSAKFRIQTAYNRGLQEIKRAARTALSPILHSKAR